MGRRSTKENKNIYQLSREELSVTRDKASELLEYISADRIEKIESGKTLPQPDEILTMAKCYKKPHLPNYYCSHECPIGQEYVPEIEIKELSQIVLEMLGTLNYIDGQKNRLIEITMDGKITEDEFNDFRTIQNMLNKISLTADSLQLWIESSIANGQIDIELWDSSKE